jgi:hypothetical protein
VVSLRPGVMVTQYVQRLPTLPNSEQKALNFGHSLSAQTCRRFGVRRLGAANVSRLKRSMVAPGRNRLRRRRAVALEGGRGCEWGRAKALAFTGLPRSNARQ